MQLYPQSPDFVWPGHLHGTGCLSARAMDNGLPTVVCCLCLGLRCALTPLFLAGVQGVCVLAGVSASPRHSRLGFVVRVFRVGFRGCGERGFCGFGSPPCGVLAEWWSPSPASICGPLALRPRSPFRLGFSSPFFFLCVCVAGGTPLIRWGVRRRVRGVLSSGPSAAMWSCWDDAFGCTSPGWAAQSPGVPSGGPVGVAFGVAWLGRLPASCELGGRLRGCVSAPPVFLSSRWPAGARLWLGLGSPFCFPFCLFAGASTGRHSVWLTASLLVLLVAAARAPAPWVRWVMYTLGLVAYPVRLGAGSAGWAVAPAGFVRSWVRGGGVALCPPTPAVPVWWWRV